MYGYVNINQVRLLETKVGYIFVSLLSYQKTACIFGKKYLKKLTL